MEGYLTEELKKYYLAELEKCERCSDEEWDLDEGVKPVIDKVNSNKDFVTMLSKYGTQVSFLQIAFTEEGENKLKLFSQKLKQDLLRVDHKHGFYCYPFSYKDPENNAVPEGEVVSPELQSLDCITNVPKYTAINSVMFFLKSPEHKLHKKFWQC